MRPAISNGRQRVSMPTFDKRTIQRIRVPAGFLFAAVFLIFSQPTVWSIVVGSTVALIGMGVRAWAAGHIRKAKTLAVCGPYAYTRNPLYLGSLLIAIGFTVAGGVWWLVVLSVLLFLGIYLPVMSIEVQDMRRIFGAQYAEYEREVPAFIPRATRWCNSGERFDFSLYLQYREYRAAIGTVAAIGVLVAKMFLVR